MLGWEEDHSDDELPTFQFDGDDVVNMGQQATQSNYGHYEDDDEDEESALFVREQLQFEPTRAQGKLVSIVAGGDQLVMATDKRLVIALAMSGEQKLFIIPKKSNDDLTYKIFCDPQGQHCLVTLHSKKNFYISLGQNSRKPIPLPKLRNIRLESVVWQKQSSKVMTGRLLLGTSDGCIYEYEIYDNKERQFAKLFDLKTEQYGSTLNSEESKDNKCWKICGLHVEKLAMPKDIHGRHSNSKRASQVYEAQNEKLKGLGFLDDDSDSEEQSQQQSRGKSGTDGRGISTSGVSGGGGGGDGMDGRKKTSGYDGNDTSNIIHGSGSSSKSRQMFYVIAAIPSALYEFVGGPSYDDLFKQYNSRTTHKQMLTDGALKHTKLEVYAPHGDMPEAVGWLTEVGITMCPLSLGSQITPHSFVVGEKLTDMKEDHIIRYNPIDQNDDWHGKEGEIPISFVITQFHVIIIYSDCYLAINKLNKKCVHYDSFPVNKAGFCKEVTVMDSTIFTICDSQIFQIRPQNEKRDVWELYLHKNEFHSALQYATTSWQKQRVLRREAEYHFESGSYEDAAIKYTELSDINRARNARRNNHNNGMNNLHQVEMKERSRDIAVIQEEDAALDVTFEEIALKFLNVNATDALMRFLSEKLNRINNNDKTQRSILATWLCEMHLAKINESTHDPDEEAAAIDDFEDFFNNFKNVLGECKDVVRNLIASHGRPEILIDFARSQQDWSFVTQYYVGQGQYKNAITVLGSLQQPRHFEDLYYTYAPVLMYKHPVETVDMLVKIKSLDPKKLIPALMRYDTVDTMISAMTGNITSSSYNSNNTNNNNNTRNGGMAAMMEDDTVITSQQTAVGMDFDFDDNIRKSTISRPELKTQDANENDPLRHDITRMSETTRNRGQNTVSEEHANQAIRYLEHSIANKTEKSQDTTIHNYLVSLYCKQPDETALLDFIESQKKKPIFDVKYALRLCHQENKTRSCVELYKIMKLYQEAVMLALNIKENHFALAKSIAFDFKELEPTKKAEQKNLWLIIAKHVVGTSGDNIDSVLRIIGESNNILSIEDILPCLNDFTQIGPFKEDIKKSLEKYSKDINKLQNEMEQYTKNADDIRNDTKELTYRSAMVTSNRKCDLSGQNVLGSQFLLFPCTHVFRLDALLNRIQQYRIQNKLPLLKKNTLESELMEIASEQCPLCGDMMIDEVIRPFIDDDDFGEAQSWQIDDEITQVTSLAGVSNKLGR